MSDPKHMDVASRNQRLRETLEGMGLFVLPIYSESDQHRIDYMLVSVDLPTHIKQGVGEPTACTRVAEMVPGANIRGHVKAADSSRDNVIDLPSVSR